MPFDPADSFFWWLERTPGRVYLLDCPGCGNSIRLKQRLAQAKRYCPGCGRTVDTATIDANIKGKESQRTALAKQERSIWNKFTTWVSESNPKRRKNGGLAETVKGCASLILLAVLAPFLLAAFVIFFPFSLLIFVPKKKWR